MHNLVLVLNATELVIFMLCDFCLSNKSMLSTKKKERKGAAGGREGRSQVKV